MMIHKAYTFRISTNNSNQQNDWLFSLCIQSFLILIGSRIQRDRKRRDVKGRIVNATVRRNPFGRYFMSLLVETEVQELPKTHSYIGIDVGLKDFVILSDGTPYKNSNFFQSLEDRLAKVQRVLSRRMKGSSRWNKQRVKVARKDELDKISTKTSKKHDVIGIENLQVSNLLKNHKLAKAISEVSWSQFQTMLEYKTKWYGKKSLFYRKHLLPANYALVMDIETKTLKI
ncbi:transposase [Bacillus cereus]|nr:RNA-guided endonuclease TnpB family protein [Bacillus cereus]WHS75889.1 transposase [Bacillus cereus]